MLKIPTTQKCNNQKNHKYVVFLFFTFAMEQTSPNSAYLYTPSGSVCPLWEFFPIPFAFCRNYHFALVLQICYFVYERLKPPIIISEVIYLKKVILVVLICVFLTSCAGNNGHKGGARMIKADTKVSAFIILLILSHFLLKIVCNFPKVWDNAFLYLHSCSIQLTAPYF